MRAWDIVDGLFQPVDEDKPSAKQNKIRHLDDSDYQSFEDAGNERVKSPPKNLNQVRAMVKARNPIKWMQIQGDLKWIKKQLKRLGYESIDPRDLL